MTCSGCVSEYLPAWHALEKLPQAMLQAHIPFPFELYRIRSYQGHFMKLLSYTFVGPWWSLLHMAANNHSVLF